MCALSIWTRPDMFFYLVSCTQFRYVTSVQTIQIYLFSPLEKEGSSIYNDVGTLLSTQICDSFDDPMMTESLQQRSISPLHSKSFLAIILILLFWLIL